MTTADKLRQAVHFLQEAILCRRLDMWTWEAANRALAQYRSSLEFAADNDGQPYHLGCKVTSRVNRISSIIEGWARNAFALHGLTTGAAIQIGTKAGQAARASYAVQPSNGTQAQAQAKQQAEMAITAALASGIEPSGHLRLRMAQGALLQTDVWNAFVALAGPLDAGHVEIHEALCSCLSELTAEYAHLLQ